MCTSRSTAARSLPSCREISASKSTTASHSRRRRPTCTCSIRRQGRLCAERTRRANRLLNDLVRPQRELLRDRKPESFCSPRVDHQLELRRLFHRNFARVGAFEDLVDHLRKTKIEVGI